MTADLDGICSIWDNLRGEPTAMFLTVEDVPDRIDIEILVVAQMLDIFQSVDILARIASIAAGGTGWMREAGVFPLPQCR